MVMGPGTAHWKRIDSTRCVSRIGVTPVGRFASGCFRSKGFNIKPRPRLASPARLHPSGMETRERQCGVFAESISSVYIPPFFSEVQLRMFLRSMCLSLCRACSIYSWIRVRVTVRVITIVTCRTDVRKKI